MSNSFRRRRGATVVEYALLLAFVAGAVLLGAAVLGQVAEHQFIATQLAEVEAAGAADLDPRPLSEVFLDDTETESAEFWSVWQLVGIAVSVALNILLWVMLCNRRKIIEETEQPHLVNENAVFQKRQVILQVLSKNLNRLLTNRLEVRHLMSRELTTAPPTCSVMEARTIMHDQRIRHLLICNADQQLVGIVSIRDLAKPGQTVADIMTSKLVCTPPNASISQTITTFLRRRISCIPVIENERCCGVLTTTDLMMAFQCGMFLMQRECELDEANTGSDQQPNECYS